MSIGRRIKDRRHAKGYTLDELAKKVGTSKQTIFRYETDAISNIPPDKIESLALALSTTPAYLMGWEEKEKPVDKDELAINTIVMNCNGKITRKTLTKEQMEMLSQMIEGISEKNKRKI